MRLLDHYQSILAGYKTAVIDDVKEKLFGRNIDVNKNINPPESETTPTNEEFFYTHSKAILDLKRSPQALHYNDYTYGMECNACCVMYFLQSFGIIPTIMSRKHFEFAFTTLIPNFNEHIRESDKNTDLLPDYIIVDGDVIPRYKSDKVFTKEERNKKLLFEDVFFDHEDFLMGKYGSSSIQPHKYSKNNPQTSEEIKNDKLRKICQNFISYIDKYLPNLKCYRRVNSTTFNKGFMNMYAYLQEPNLLKKT